MSFSCFVRKLESAKSSIEEMSRKKLCNFHIKILKFKLNYLTLFSAHKFLKSIRVFLCVRPTFQIRQRKTLKIHEFTCFIYRAVFRHNFKTLQEVFKHFLKSLRDHPPISLISSLNYLLHNFVWTLSLFSSCTTWTYITDNIWGTTSCLYQLRKNVSSAIFIFFAGNSE